MPYIELRNISLYYEDGGVGDPPILLLHELGGSSESWRRVIPLITPHRRVIAPDMRCAGRSEKPPAAFEITDVASDIEALLDTLHIARVDVIGAALGAMVAALMASRSPQRVRRMVLCAITDAIDQRTREYLNQRAERLRQVGMRGVMEASLVNAFPEPHAAVRAGYRPIYLANDPAGYAELSKALARMSVTPDLWRHMPCPALIMSGRHDFIWPPELGRRVANLLPRATFLELADAGHFPHLHTPEVLTDAALRFLSRTSS
jgi:3-oxoadipate enol-lactonase